MAMQVTNEIVKIVRTDDGLFEWTRQGGNNRVTHRSKRPLKTKYSAVVSAVRENPDVYRENVLDVTSGKPKQFESKVVERLPRKNK